MKKSTSVLFLVLCVVFSALLMAQAPKAKIYMTDIDSWQFQGQAGQMRGRGNDVIEASNHFLKLRECSNLSMITSAKLADYAFIFAPGAWWSVREVMVVQIDNEEVVYAGKAWRFKNVVKDACRAVRGRKLGN